MGEFCWSYQPRLLPRGVLKGASIPGFTGILATLSLLGAVFIRRNE